MLNTHNNKKGFTLIEMVVVLSVVAILAAILTPTIMKNINDSKIARANNEVQVIAAAMASFFKDTGRWPTSNGTAGNPDYLYILHGPSTANDMNSGGYSAYWGNGASWSSRKDLIENHLMRNQPGINGTAGGTVYGTTGELRWNGPYLTSLKADPWGVLYSSNVISLWYTGGNYEYYRVFVLSAGSDKVAQTSFAQDYRTTTPATGGDDIGVRIK
jgi:prepilin-type N-terminal cleavage/methylation domain-containing protein